MLFSPPQSMYENRLFDLEEEIKNIPFTFLRTMKRKEQFLRVRQKVLKKLDKKNGGVTTITPCIISGRSS